MTKYFTKGAILSLIYNLIYNFPLLFISPIKLNIVEAIAHMVIIYISITILFFLFIPIKYIRFIFIPLSFCIGGAADYYLISFGHRANVGAIIDLFSVEKELVFEYLSLPLFIIFIVSILLGIWLLKKIQATGNKLIYVVFIVLILIPTFIYRFNYRDINFILLSYQPFTFFHEVKKYLMKLPEYKKIQNKTDLTETNNFTLNKNAKEPRIVVLIIGESMRGDLVSLNGFGINNTPLLRKQNNLISFTKAKSNTTSTRSSLPFMLTSAIYPDFEQALSEKSIISIFKKIGFKTSWIGNQGLHGIYENNFASIALEADYVIQRKDIRKRLTKYKTYDEDLLFFLDERMKGVSDQNHFIVIHLFGSHWNFEDRYPENFTNFKPICMQSTPYQCGKEELKNSYYNTIFYTDYVIDQIINRLKNKNAFIIYASDHGIPLGEKGKTGGSGDDGGPHSDDEEINIAMFAWMSDIFLANHKEYYFNILSRKDKLITHDAIFPSLLDCSDIHSDYIDKTLSICK